MSATPDWSQFMTKDDLAKAVSQLDTRMSQSESRLGQSMSQLDTRMSQMEVRLIRWMVGIFLTFLALLGGLVTIALNVTAIARTLHNFLS